MTCTPEPPAPVENESAKRKIADRPHYVAIILSTAAVIVSGFSWWEASRNRRLNEDVNRPVFSIVKVDKHLSARPKQEGEGDTFDFVVDVKNIGRSTARILKAEVEPHIHRAFGNCGLAYPNKTEIKYGFQRETPQGTERLLNSVVTITTGCESSRELGFRLNVILTYLDTSSGIEYYQSEMEYLSVSPSELRTKLKDMLPAPEVSPQ